jgi:23S rRNA (uracil747-C5)-methyltransferase
MQKLPDLLVLFLLFVPAPADGFSACNNGDTIAAPDFEGFIMQCALYDAGRCRSCQWLERPVATTRRQNGRSRTLLADAGREWCAPVSGPEQGFVTKPKWWSAAALRNRCWGCCTATAPRKI